MLIPFSSIRYFLCAAQLVRLSNDGQVESLIETLESVPVIGNGSQVLFPQRDISQWCLLKDALDHGLSRINRQHMADDSDLRSLHGDPEFEALLAEAQKSANTGQKTDTPN
jgi:hypothetical protein